MKTKRWYLYMKLGRNVPKWWPRKGREIEPVGVFIGGEAWVSGDGQPMTLAQIEAAKELLRFDYKGQRPVFTTRAVS